jgi:Fic family protein
MSRLLTLLLLYRAGYSIGKYISIEKLVEQSKETYYETLYESSVEWHEGTNDYAPFVKYTLGTILAAYRNCENRVELLLTSGLSKPDRVKEIISEKLGRITKREILEEYPDISEVTVQRTLRELLKNGDIIKLGGGRYTEYIWNREKD